MSTILIDNKISVLDPKKLARECQRHGVSTKSFWNLANCFRTQRGRHPGMAFLLLTREDVEKINKGPTEHVITFNDGIHEKVDIWNLYFIGARNVLSGALGDKRAPYLCTFADARYFALNPNYGVPLNKLYNVRCSGFSGDIYYKGSMDAGVPWTWKKMAQDIWYNMMLHQKKLLGAPPKLPFEPHGVPENWVFIQRPAWSAYNEVMERLSCEVCINFAINGDQAYITRIGEKIIYPQEKDSLWNMWLEKHKKELLFSEEPISSDYVLPERVDVVFHKYYKHYGSEMTTTSTEEQWATNPVEVISFHYTQAGVSAKDLKPLSMTRVTLYDDMWAVVNYDGSIGNYVDLQARALERAKDYYRSHRGYVKYLHNYYSGWLTKDGNLAWDQPSALAVYDFGNGPMTETLNVTPDVVLRVDNKGEWVEEKRITDRLRHPDLDRVTFPVYPHLLQSIRVVSAVPNQEGFYQAFVQRYNPETNRFEDKEPCLAVDLNA